MYTRIHTLECQLARNNGRPPRRVHQIVTVYNTMSEEEKKRFVNPKTPFLRWYTDNIKGRTSVTATI